MLLRNWDYLSCNQTKELGMTEKLELDDLIINESTKISIYGTTIIIDQISQFYEGVIGDYIYFVIDDKMECFDLYIDFNVIKMRFPLDFYDEEYRIKLKETLIEYGLIMEHIKKKA